MKKSFWYSLIFMCDNFSRSRSSQHPILKNCTSCFCPILNLFHRTGSKHRYSLDFFIFPGQDPCDSVERFSRGQDVWQCWNLGTGCVTKKRRRKKDVWQCWKGKSALSTFPSVRDSAQAGQTKFQKIEKDKIPKNWKRRNSNRKIKIKNAHIAFTSNRQTCIMQPVYDED